MSKKVNHKNRTQIDFLSNRTQVMDELSVLRFWIVIVNNFIQKTHSRDGHNIQTKWNGENMVDLNIS